DSPQEEQKKLQGTWKVVSAEVDGVAAPRERFKAVTYRFDGDKMIEQQGEHRSDRRYRLDPSATPRAIDIRRTFTSFQARQGQVEKQPGEVTDLGIYRLEGD